MAVIAAADSLPGDRRRSLRLVQNRPGSRIVLTCKTVAGRGYRTSAAGGGNGVSGRGAPSGASVRLRSRGRVPQAVPPGRRTRGDPAIRRSGDPAIRRSGDPAIRRSGIIPGRASSDLVKPCAKQFFARPTMAASAAPSARTVFRPSLTIASSPNLSPRPQARAERASAEHRLIRWYGPYAEPGAKARCSRSGARSTLSCRRGNGGDLAGAP